jgi:hypothetical protein
MANSHQGNRHYKQLILAIDRVDASVSATARHDVAIDPADRAADAKEFCGDATGIRKSDTDRPDRASVRCPQPGEFTSRNNDAVTIRIFQRLIEIEKISTRERRRTLVALERARSYS